MFPSWIKRQLLTQSSRTQFALAATIAVASIVMGCTGSPYFPTKPVVPNGVDASLVRGYLAVVVGRSGNAEKDGLYSRAVDPRDIYLPAVTVYLQDVATATTSPEVRTDLSGRFTLQAPAKGKYRLCWKSDVYGADCLQSEFSAGHEALFLSTQRIRIAPKKDFAASFGKVQFADESAARTLEPFSDINAFAVVQLVDRNHKVLAQVPVNNLGDYLLPHVPVTEPFALVAKMEKTESAHTVQPENFVKNAHLMQYDLTLRNTPPRLDAIVPRDAGTGRRVQVGAPGQKLDLQAATRDRDGHAVQVKWLLPPGGGTLSATTGAQVQWTLPSEPGRHSVKAIVSDQHGGYASFEVRLPVGAPGVAFGGTVVNTNAVLLKDAEVDINGKLFKTDAQGRFMVYIPEADRYVFNIRKEGYGLYSRVYDRTVAGGRWTLVQASVAEFDGSADIVFQDRRAAGNCPGPHSARINWNEKPLLKNVFWQDGKGNTIAPPNKFKNATQRPVLPWERKTQTAEKGDKAECGPGLALRIPANGLQDASGAAPVGKVVVSVSTVDLASPEQMPGDDGVDMGGTSSGWMQSYGAGTVELRDKANGNRLNLRPGVKADVTIPVDAMQLAAGGTLPATAPLLYYNETQGIWKQEGTLKLDATGKNYVTKVKHFSALNTDITFTNPSCVRVESTLPTPYDLEVTIPMPGGAAPKVKTITITDAPPHVIHHLPNHTKITIVAIAPGVAPTPPRSLGIFIVDTGPPQAGGFGSPPPASACATQVTLSAKTFDTSPTGGEFLHGLFAFSATTINESDIAVLGSPSQLLDQATINYYQQVDGLNERTTLTGFRNKNGFTKPPGFQLCAGVPCIDPDTEINAVYANSGDLGFGRDMHCRRTATASGYDYACYVTNYGDITTDDTLDATNAHANIGIVATVAMEFSALSAGDPVTDRHVKFYVYNAAGNRVNRADLDGKGARPVPQLCMVCHGGAYPGGGTTGVPAFSTPASVKMGSRFLPFDMRFFTFPAALSKADQQAAVKHLNQDIVLNAPALPAPSPIADVITAMYAGGASTQHEEFVVDGWKQTQLPNTVAQEQFYRRVVGNTCRACHMAQPFANASAERIGMDLTFGTAQSFLRNQPLTNGTTQNALSLAELRVCTEHLMPHAQRTHDIFWGQYWSNDFGAISPTLPAQMQAFGETMKALPRPPSWPLGETWPPAWNGEKCANQFVPPGATPPSFYSTHVHPLWSRNWTTATCAGCHTGALGGNATATRNSLLVDFDGGGIKAVANDPVNSEVLQRVKGIGPHGKMPYQCPTGKRCLNTSAGTYDPATDAPASTASEVNRIEYWITHGALP